MIIQCGHHSIVISVAQMAGSVWKCAKGHQGGEEAIGQGKLESEDAKE